MANAEKVVPEISIELDKKRTAKMGNFGIMALEKEFDISIFADIDWKKLRWTDILRLLWASLLEEEPTLKFSDMDKIAHLQDLNTLEPFIRLVVGRAFPSAEEGSSDKAVSESEKKSK